MKIVRNITLVLLLAAILTACSNAKSQEVNNNTNQSGIPTSTIASDSNTKPLSSDNIDKNNNTKSQDNNDNINQQVAPTNNQSSGPTTMPISSNSTDEYIKYIKDNLKIAITTSNWPESITIDKVISAFGQYNQRVYPVKPYKNVVYNLRYDFICDEGYKYTDENDLDYIDIDGILKGKVKLILMIGFSQQDKVVDYTLYYFKGKLCEYRATNAGSVRETQINGNMRKSNSVEEPYSSISPDKLNEYIKQIKENIKIGISTDKVTSLFGPYNQKPTSAEPPDNVAYFYRYDLLCDEGYKFNVVEGADCSELDEILNGYVRIVMYVGFSEKNTVNYLIYYYLDTTNSKVCEYRMFQDGTVRESQIR